MILQGGNSLLSNSRNVTRQTRLIAGSSILMDQTFVHRFVDKRNRRTKRIRAKLLVAVSDRRAKALDLSAKFAAIAAIDQIPLRGLSNSFFCRFMICHSNCV